ncbi:iron chelate uptake ABC transporter family permease subunit [Suttonella ornithocola]|uniref:Iron-uptake system permease protein FeuC n=1 Tax=Suttonella ornithocola TaxID=279832 RepID=A0A380MKK7_9GAMM|nr:iron chelate uptake ABC transporter family permease subunit [Suttonella ornithocola]SUO93175.1 Iron-uptake system permease protein FeuC [Suttonella ornithocola]
MKSATKLSYRLLLTLVLSLIITGIYLFYPSANGYNRFILTLRTEQILTLLTLAVSGGLSTLIFQTLTHNRLLTPEIMGLDRIYLILQIALIALFGSQTFSQINPTFKFFITTLITIFTATLFYRILLNKLSGDLFRLLLIGVIFSLLCRSLTEFIARLLDPTEFAVYQSVSFAQINSANRTLLGISLCLIIIISLLLWTMRYRLDILALGRETAISLGLAYQKHLTLFLIATSILVAISTALVGPILFFGLLATALTYRLFPTHYHSILLPAVSLVSYLILIGGQLAFERLFHLSGTLSIAVESLGGITFLILITRRAQS